jgi:hypothetical protein
MMFTNSCPYNLNALFLLSFMVSNGTFAITPVAKLRGEVAPVAVRHDGWIPQLMAAV